MRWSHVLRRAAYACTLLAATPWLQNCGSNANVTGGTTGSSGATTGATGTTAGGGGVTAGTTGGGSTGGTTGGAATKSVQVSGAVSSSVFSTGSAFLATLPTCNSASFSLYAIGGGNTAVATGTASADGNFAVSWNVNADPNVIPPEVVLHFACPTSFSANLRCFGKPGDAGLVCDPISNALASALEKSIGQNLETSQQLQGLSVAKIVQGLAETLKLVSRLNPTQDVVSQLAQATDPNALAALIAGSPLGSLFTSISTIASQTIAQNQLGANANNLGAALQQVWTPGKTIELLASLGLTLNVGVDDSGDGGPSIYGDLADAIDVGTGSHFMHETAQYLSDLYEALYLNAQPSQVSLLCVAQRFSDSGYVPSLQYAPDATQDGNMWRLSCLGDTAVDLGVAVTGTDGNNPNNANIGLQIASSFAEADRNDPTGTHAFGSAIDLGMSLIDVFPEFIAGISPPNGACQAYVAPGDNGPGPGTQWAQLGNCIYTNHLGQYFAGVLGVYRFLTDTQVTGVKVSLQDIYGALVDRAGLRLTPQGPNFPTPYFQGSVDLGNGDTQGFGTPLLLADANSTVDGAELYRGFCPPYLCGQSGRPVDGPINFSLNDVNDLLQRTRPRYQEITGMFENIPGFAQLRQQIFTSAHHIEYNPSGGAFWSVSGVDPDGNYQASLPILCAFKRGNTVVPNLAPDAPVTCEIAQGTWTDGLQVGNTPDYFGYFGLAPREGSGDSRYYALIDRYTGNEYTFNGQPFRILDISAGTSSNVNDDGATLYAGSDQYCNSVQTASGVQTSCWTNAFGYVALTFPNINADGSLTAATSFYPETQYSPFSITWPITTWDQNNNARTQWQQVAFASGSQSRSSTDFSAGYAICVRGNAVTTDANQSWVVTQADLNSGNLGGCDKMGANGDLYYFVTLSYGGGATNPNNYVYNLFRSDGQYMQASLCKGGGFCPYTLDMLDVEDAVGSVAGPALAQQYMLNYQIVNLQHDAKFDPFCVADSNDRHCDCYRNGVHLTSSSSPDSSTCTLDDAHGDMPTLAVSPLGGNVPSATAAAFWRIINEASGLSGGPLANKLFALAQIGDGGLSVTSIQVNWNSVFVCANGNTLMNVNLDEVGNPNHFQDAGQGCGDGNGMNGNAGPVTLKRIIQRDNAYDIARPQTMLKLIATATQDTGTGVALSGTTPLFNFQQALALEFARLLLPFSEVHAELQDFSNDPNAFVAPAGLQVLPITISPPSQDDSGVKLPGAMLRIFLEKAGAL